MLSKNLGWKDKLINVKEMCSLNNTNWDCDKQRELIMNNSESKNSLNYLAVKYSHNYFFFNSKIFINTESKEKFAF